MEERDQVGLTARQLPQTPSNDERRRYLRRRQQRTACDVCRHRKVRCDILLRSGGACAVCSKLGATCRVSGAPLHQPGPSSTTPSWSAYQLPPSSAWPTSPPPTRNADSLPRRAHAHAYAPARARDRRADDRSSPSPGGGTPASAQSRSQGHGEGERRQPELRGPLDTSITPDQIERSSQREEYARSGLARFFNLGILSSRVWTLFDTLDAFRIAYIGTAVSNLSHLVNLQTCIHLPSSNQDSNHVDVNAPGLTEDAGSEWAPQLDVDDTESSPRALHYPHPPIRPPKSWRPGPETWGLSSQADLASDLSSFPTPAVRNALVDAYFEHIHPVLPVLSKIDFLARYHNPDNPPPLLIYQTVLMAGAHACSHSYVVKHRQALKVILFQRASMLYHLRHETDRANLLQAAILFTWHVGDGDSIAGGPYYWSGIAIRVGCGLGVHRHSATLPRIESIEYRRAWWCAFVCEVFSALETGRPCAVRSEDIDQTMLTEEDMASKLRFDPVTPDREVDAHFLICMAQLAYFGLEISSLHAPSRASLIEVRSIDTRLGHWLVRSGVCSATDEDESSTCQLRLHYHLLLLYLHRNFPGEPHSESMCSTSASTIVSLMEKIASEGWLRQCHFSVISAATAAGIQLVTEIRAAVLSHSYLAAMHSVERLARLLRFTSMLAEYWPNAEAIYTVFKNLHRQFEACATSGLLGEQVNPPGSLIDWNPLLFGIDLSMYQTNGIDLSQPDGLGL